MTKRNRRLFLGICKPACEALDGRALLSVLGPSPDDPPAEVAEPGELGPTLELLATTPASGAHVAESLTQIRLQFDRPLDEFSLGMSVRLDRLDDGSTLWDVFETLDPDDPRVLVLNLGQALEPGSYRVVLPMESLLSGLDGAFLDVLAGDQIASEFQVAAAEAIQADLGILGGDVLTIPGTLDLASNPNAEAMYRVQISPSHSWWRVGVELSTYDEGSTLRPVLSLYTADGRLIRTSQTGRPDTPNNPYLFAGLPAGTYLIGVSGTDVAPVSFGLFGFSSTGPSTFALSLVAEPADTPTSVLGFQLDFADPNSKAPTGFSLQFSGPMSPSDPSLKGHIGLEVIDARGRVWPVTAVGYNESSALLNVLLDQRLPAGSYTVRLAPSGGLTDLAGVSPVRHGLPAGELARFLVEAGTEATDPLDLGALYPEDLARGITRSLSLAPGATAQLRLVVLHPGQFRFTFDSDTGARLTSEAGGVGLTSDDLATLPFLSPGVYTLTLSNRGGESTTTTVTVEAQGSAAESLLLNGMGQGSALNVRLVAPSGGLSNALPVAATPGPSTDSHTVATNPAPWTGAFLGLVPGPIGGTPSSGDDASAAPLTTTSGPQSAGGLALGLSVELVGAAVSQPTLVALATPAAPGGLGPGMGQGMVQATAVASFPGANPSPDAAITNALALAADRTPSGHFLAGVHQVPGDIGSPLTLVRLDAPPEAGAELVETLDGERQLARRDVPGAEDEPEEAITQFAAIDPCLALTAATVVAIQFRDRIRNRLGRGTRRSHARPVPLRWSHGFSPRVLNH